jgi:hypothetical protein
MQTRTRCCVKSYSSTKVGVSDHPVCGAKVGCAEIFLDAAATPPHEEETT